MFVKCKKNQSGFTSVQIIDKSSGKYVVFQTVGSSTDTIEINFSIVKVGKSYSVRKIGQKKHQQQRL